MEEKPFETLKNAFGESTPKAFFLAIRKVYIQQGFFNRPSELADKRVFI